MTVSMIVIMSNIAIKQKFIVLRIIGKLCMEVTRIHEASLMTISFLR